MGEYTLKNIPFQKKNSMALKKELLKHEQT